MNGVPILSLMLLVPLIGAVACLLAGRNDARAIALAATLVDLVLGAVLWSHYQIGGPPWQFQEHAAVFAGFEWKLGIDGIALVLIALTVFLMPICIGASWNAIEKRAGEYYANFLVMETLMIGVFSAQDLFLFYIMFEAGLIPMYLIIGIWGGADRIYASYKFFLYTLLGSVLMLIAMMWMAHEAGTTDIPTLMEYSFPVKAQFWLWLAFFASFAVKMPMWPTHTWLPDAHVQAPTAGSVILAGVLLKMGGYGFIRFSLPMFPNASEYFAPFVLTLSLIAIIYTSLVALVQEDVKKLIAYSSVAHMGYVTMGIFTLTPQGIEGAMYQMVSHGIVSAALFLCVGVIYDRMHTREISAYGGLVNRMPMYAAAMMIFTMANVGLPGTSGFIGEFLTLLAARVANSWVALAATSGVILSAAYGLWMYARVVLGKLVKPELMDIKDVSAREFALLAPLAFLTIYYGFNANAILHVFAVPTEPLLAAMNAAIGAVKTAAVILP